MSQRREATGQRATNLASTNDSNLHCPRSLVRDVMGMAGRYTGSYLDRSNSWRAIATLADIGRASLVGRIPKGSVRTL
jgi:hypothetical protein